VQLSFEFKPASFSRITDSLLTVMRAVLPAINLDPAGAKLEAGFLRRAFAARKVRVRALNGVELLLAFAGVSTAEDPNESAAAAIKSVLSEQLPSEARTLLVAWIDTNEQPYIAVVDVLAPEKLIAASWMEPESWDPPMPDWGLSLQELIARAMTRLETALTERQLQSAEDFDARCKRALAVIELILRRFKGESPHTSHLPARGASDAECRIWYERFRKTIDSEISRLSLTRPAPFQDSALPSQSSELDGLRVFISYPRSAGADLAWPVRDALLSCGARVWFDQTDIPDPVQLSKGLAAVIADCDAYVMCASDDFMERAGYATQELAWLLSHITRNGTRKKCAVVAVADTVLPSCVQTWPLIYYGGDSTDKLRTQLLGALLEDHDEGVPALRAPLPDSLPDLPTNANTDLIAARAKHTQVFTSINSRHVERYVLGEDNAETRHVLKLLSTLGQSLGWDGKVGSIHAWPTDSLIRDMRLRMCMMRTCAATYLPLGDWDLDRHWLTEEIDFLASQPVPILDWQLVPGWDDGSRRYALRSHASALRLLEQMLAVGRAMGLDRHVTNQTCRDWGAALRQRRLECLDALVALRVNLRLSWSGDTVEWPTLFESWSKILASGRWQQTVPAHVTQIIGMRVGLLAGVGAEVTWYAARTHREVIQRGDMIPIDSSYSFVVRASTDVLLADATSSEPYDFMLSLCPDDSPVPALWLHWNSSVGVPSGHSKLTSDDPELTAAVRSSSSP
jgi:hypothetical protein